MKGRLKPPGSALLLVALLLGFLLGGLDLLSLPSRLAEGRAKLASLRGEVGTLRNALREMETLEGELAELEAKAEALLKEPIPEGALVPTVARIAIENGWKGLALKPAKEETQGAVRYRKAEISWTASWKELLSGLFALKERGIFLKELEVDVKENGLFFRGVLVRPEPANPKGRGGSR